MVIYIHGYLDDYLEKIRGTVKLETSPCRLDFSPTKGQ